LIELLWWRLKKNGIENKRVNSDNGFKGP